MAGQGCCIHDWTLHSEGFGCTLPVAWEMKTEIPADAENLPHNAEHEYFQRRQLVGRSVGTMASWAAIPYAA